MKMGINKITFLLLLVIPLSACRTNKEYSVDIQTKKTEEKISQIIVSLDKDNDPTIDHYQKIEEFDDDIHKSEEDTKSRDKEKETPDDSKYLEMDIKQFLIDNYNFKEEEIDPDYDLISFMKYYRYDEKNVSEEEVRKSFEEDKIFYLPGTDGYVDLYLTFTDAEKITPEDKIVKIAFMWHEYKYTVRDNTRNVLYDLEKGKRYSDGSDPVIISEEEIARLSRIVSIFDIDEWDLEQDIIAEQSEDIDDGGSGAESWKLVFELDNGKKKAYTGHFYYDSEKEMPNEWPALESFLLAGIEIRTD